jgi:hypothetical protein
VIWDFIGIGYRSPLVFIRGRLNAHRYNINEILRAILLPLLNEHAGVVFQEDNARLHIAQISRRTFPQQAEVEILPWPARSADLNPIEHVWVIMGRCLRHFPQQANSLEELLFWDEIPQEEIDHLIRNMHQRVRECIANHGDVTHY